MIAYCRCVAEARWFEPFMIGLILFNAVLIGLETSHGIVQSHGRSLHLGNDIILWVFVVEAALKITAVAPRFSLYFRSGWNLFHQYGAKHWGTLGTALLTLFKIVTLEELRDPVTHEEVLDELKRTRDALAGLQRRLETLPVSRVSDRS